MIQFCARDIFIRKKIYILLLVVLVLISSTTNTILIYFFQEINMDRSTNKYYNIYMMDTSEISNEQTIKLLQELTKSKRFHVTGSFFVGNLLVNSNTYKCVAFTYSDVKKFYQTKSNLTATDGRMIVDGSLSPNLLNYLEYKEVDVSNLIYACDLSEHIDFVFSKNDYAKRGIQTQRLGVEFDKHLTIPEVRALKKITSKYIKANKIEYQKIVSKYALKDLKNTLIISFLMILYTFFSTMGILEYAIKMKHKIFTVYLMYGMSQATLLKMLLCEIIFLDGGVFLNSFFVSSIICDKLHLHTQGMLCWVPHLLTALVIVASSVIMALYSSKTYFKNDIIQSYH